MRTTNEQPVRGRTRCIRRAGDRAFSLIETVIAIGILSVMYAAALNAVGASKVGQRLSAENRRGFELAQDLLAEIVSQPYWDPTALSGLGAEAGETTPANRSLFDDVDDYANYTEPSIQRKDGTAVSDLSGWTRYVVIFWVNPNNLDQYQFTESGAKRILVIASYNGKAVAWLDAVRANVD